MKKQRAGITVTEAVVGMAVLAVVIPTMSRLYVGSRRLMQQTRHQHLVLDELTRHAETALVSPGSLPKPILSPELLGSLPTATLTQDSELDDASELQRVTWTIRWGDTGDGENGTALTRSLSVWLPVDAGFPIDKESS